MLKTSVQFKRQCKSRKQCKAYPRIQACQKKPSLSWPGGVIINFCLYHYKLTLHCKIDDCLVQIKRVSKLLNSVFIRKDSRFSLKTPENVVFCYSIMTNLCIVIN